MKALLNVKSWLALDCELEDGESKKAAKLIIDGNSIHIELSKELEVVVSLDGFNRMLHVEIQRFGLLSEKDDDHLEMFALEQL